MRVWNTSTEAWETVPDLLVSPSQIALYRTCERKWNGAYVQGEREPDTEATLRGKRIHIILEDYLNGKGPIDTTSHEGRVAASGLKYLPQPLTVRCEGEFTFPPHEDGWRYHGVIDMVRQMWVGDHKTTSDFRYQKSVPELIEDPQVILYATRAQIIPYADVDCQWIYYRTAVSKAYAARQTAFRYPGRELAERKAALDLEVRHMLTKRRIPLLDLPPNESACFKYNKPCHLRHKCTDLKPSIGKLMSLSKDALLADLKAKALGVANPSGVPLPSPAAVVAPPAGLPALPALPGAAPVLAPPPAAGGLPALPALPGAAPVIAPPPAAGALPALPSLPGAAPVVTPPPAAGGLPALPALPGVTQIQTTIAPPGGLPPLPGALPVIAPPAAAAPALPVVDPAIMAAAAAEGAKGKGKAPALPTPPSPASIVAPAIRANPSASIGVLYIDCLPIGADVTPFSQVAQLCHQGIKEHAKISHYKMGDFGKGLAVWVEAVSTYVSAVPIAALYVDTSANDQRDALEALLPLAAQVVRGIK